MSRAPSKKSHGITVIEAVALSIVVAMLAVLGYQKWQRSRLQLHQFYSGTAIEELNEVLAGSDWRTRSSRNLEESVIRQYFAGRRGGVFLDVGANHYQRENNTYFLEKEFGWSGIAVEPLEEFAADYRTHRPRTRFIAMFASNVPDARVKFFVLEGDSLVSSSSREFTARFGTPTSREVPTTTLTSVLDQAGIKSIDFMSMDIELAEPKALAGFDIERFRPALVCIEGHFEVRQQILNYFAEHSYVLLGKYLRIDPHNLYFAPREHAAQESDAPHP